MGEQRPFLTSGRAAAPETLRQVGEWQVFSSCLTGGQLSYRSCARTPQWTKQTLLS